MKQILRVQVLAYLASLSLLCYGDVYIIYHIDNQILMKIYSENPIHKTVVIERREMVVFPNLFKFIKDNNVTNISENNEIGYKAAPITYTGAELTSYEYKGNRVTICVKGLIQLFRKIPRIIYFKQSEIN